MFSSPLSLTPVELRVAAWRSLPPVAVFFSALLAESLRKNPLGFNAAVWRFQKPAFQVQ
jgi:hypothetical protein